MVYIPGQSFNPYEVAPIMGARSNVMPFSTFVEPTAVAPAAPPIMGGLQQQQVMPNTQVPVTQTPPIDVMASLQGFDPQALLNLTSQILQPTPDYDPANVVYFDTGTKVNGRNAAPVVFQPGQTYTMRDRQGNAIATATTLEELQKLATLSEEVPGYVLDKPEYAGMYKTGTTEKVPDDIGLLGPMIDIGLPLLATLVPGLGTVAAMGLGTGAAGALRGRSLQDTLTRAGIAMATAGILDKTGLAQDISGALGVGQSAAATAASQKAAAEAGNILVTRSLAPLIASGAGSLASTLPDLTKTLVDIPDVAAPPTETPSALSEYGEPITVLGNRLTPPTAPPTPPIPIPDIVGGLGSGVISQLFPTQPTEQIPSEDGKPIIVRPSVEEAFSREFMEELAAAAGVGTGLAAATSAGAPTPEPEFVPDDGGITVTGSPENLLPPEYAAIPAAGVGASTLIPGTPSGEGVLDEYYGLEGGGGGLFGGIDLSKLDLSDWLNVAGLATGTLGNLFGGGGGGLSRIPAGLFGGGGGGGGGGAFGSTLPAANMPGLTAAPGGTYARQDLSDVDWATYGERPELSMFSYVPRPGEGPMPSAASLQNSIQPSPTAPPIMNEDDGRMARGGLVGYGGGGEVNGPGDGREDLIPAMLSDGEYVIDAETVALLGNGSSKAGADALDRFRVNLRKHKGQQLARGGFSTNAKSPMHYLNGAAG